MLQFRHIVMLAVLALAGCQAVSTAGPYRPANCGMVGSSCDSGR